MNHTDKRLKTPPGKQLSPEQIADLTLWINDGAAWPHVPLDANLNETNADYDRLRREHWAWQPLKVAEPPSAQPTAWPRDAVDQFILAKLNAEGLEPVADADRVTLIRRVTFDLTGLPPTNRLTPTSASSIVSWLHPLTANAGEDTGSTSLATANRPARRATFRSRTLGGIAITSSTRSTPTSRTISSSASRSPAISSPPNQRNSGANS